MLSLILAAVVNAPSPADGTYTYVTAMNGSQIAKSAVTVKHDPAGDVVLSETATGTFNGRSAAIDDTLTLNSALAPVNYSSQASLADSRSMKTALAFKNAVATQSGDVTKTYDLAADAKQFVVLDLGPFTGYFAFPAQMQAWNSPPVIAIVPMYAQGIPIAIDKSVKPDRPKDVPAADVPVSVSSPVQFTVWYDPKTLLVDQLNVPSEGVVVTRKP